MNATYVKNSTKVNNDFLLDPWSDELLAVWAPIALYWVLCSFYEILMRLEIPFFEQYRIHSPEDREKRNKVSFNKVLVMVALQHVVQIVLGFALMKGVDPVGLEIKHRKAINDYTTVLLNALISLGYTQNSAFSIANYVATHFQNFLLPCIQFFIAMVIVDTHQYVLHRLAHSYSFLYKHMHSHHHRINVPYAFGALYNHPVEGFLLDTCGAAIAFEVTGMSPRLGMYFFVFSTLKTVNDHCGYYFPWDPLTVCFGNNVNYHDLHHQVNGIKTNYAQPFFTFWDTLLQTEYSQVMKVKAEAKAAKKLN
ncbi:fatty acid hydroxylase superfamily-domain-containing protein [Thamnidium elegans]|uniref:Fatty acid hydroxylase domain-containing protein n=1 Tax=Thamnidium elegans TaxID=101142 RepID=A0A8H7STY9_9FUNG|nr:hypothetical protein INT48_002023 [Thamnidium elegans]KAI8094404.1 fatty acid hydroxylase superfamily-domain-containing protein [Thamnidium elegans]